jgi:tripartite-type tricarboxylate transporter receptor subunit TctC
LRIDTSLEPPQFEEMVRANAPWKNVAELTEAMRIKGDKASYGYGAPPALASAELYKARMGLKAVGIPYKTSMGSLPEMFSGELDFQFIDARTVTIAPKKASAMPAAHTTSSLADAANLLVSVSTYPMMQEVPAGEPHALEQLAEHEAREEVLDR